MRKLAMSIFLVASVLCFAQQKKKNTHKKSVKKSSVIKKKVNETPAAIVAAEPKEQTEAPPAEVLPAVEEKKNLVVEESPVYEKTAQKILKKKGWINNRNSALLRGIEGFVKGVYSANGKIFIMLEIANRSNINYDLQSISFITSPIDEKKNKKGIKSEQDFDTQEKIFLPIWTNQPETISKKTKQKIVYVFDKFTINENKKLNAVLSENEGERNITLEIKPSYILGAEYVN
ncbi:DUF4138 domain-containing protein (plasmid) [Chryseobacterium joostei]|uniref:DUF4138 domain-containing protein n=1 Tax=Chryseobacterium joostei TaxID=112234 RepID=A0A1N7KFV0_9FLAO|nr:DUF4138 domain-containing protein [Chryseobacterium joostei]AZB02428.1 DUF4138 domain-containing protein [Chryseobacterium joostei]SIS60463.1 protein of unknown function [Chryseobacterium joostei]